MTCVKCGNPLQGRQTMFCSSTCKSRYTVRRNRLRTRAKLIERAGGCCSVCGYSKCPQALQFHHLDPSIKEFKLGSGKTYSWKRMTEEADKCVLVCANCHAEIHSGLLVL